MSHEKVFGICENKCLVPIEKMVVDSKEARPYQSIAANDVEYFEIDVTKEGYKPIGVVGIGVEASNDFTLKSFYARSKSNEVSVTIENNSSESIQIYEIGLHVLYEKTSE